MNTSYNIGVMGWWHYDNQGDLAILENMTRALSPHQVVPIDLPYAFNEDELERLNLLDFLVVGGGGLFLNAPPPPLETFDTWGPRLRTPIGVVGLGIDDIAPVARPAVQALADQARFFYVRDRTSQQIANHPKVRVAADLTFLYPLSAGRRAGEPAPDRPLCGVNLRHAPSIAIEPWLDALRKLPLRYRGIPFSSYGAWHELKALQQLDPACAPTFATALYHGLDLMIGTAFHSIVFAIQSGVPVVAIAYAPKVQRLLEALKLDEYLLGVNDWHRLPQVVERALAQRHALVDYLAQTTAELSREVQSAFADIRQEIAASARTQRRPAARVSTVVVGHPEDAATQATVQSCRDQVGVDMEVVLVTDTPVAPTAPPATDGVRLVVSPPKTNLAGRLNQAFQHTTGDYLTWTMGGNQYARDAIACMVARLQREPGCDMVFTDYYSMHAKNLIADVHPVDSAKKLIFRNVVGPSFLYRRALADRLGAYSEDVEMPDYDFWLRAHSVSALCSLHTRPFFKLATDKPVAERNAERAVRRRWRAQTGGAWRVLWHAFDSNTAEKLFMNPLRAVRRRLRLWTAGLRWLRG